MNPNVKRHNDEGLGWTDKGGLYVRNYTNYEHYKTKQADKLKKRPGWCLIRSEELRIALAIRLREFKIEAGLSVLCLGARLGGEVQAFIDIGCFAVGLDMNPGEGSLYVVHGDFHQLQYADNSINIVYINCFDHCQYPAKLLSEIHRVLKYKGRLILEVKAGSNEQEIKSMGSDHWDSFEWDSIEVLLRFIHNHNFTLCHSYVTKLSKATPYGFVFGRV